MALPSPKEIEIPLLHLIYTLGGEVSPSDTFNPLADYFKLSEKERNPPLSVGISERWNKRVERARFNLGRRGFLSSMWGIWKITAAGKEELSRLGLLDKPFPAEFGISYKQAERERVRNYKLRKAKKQKELIQMVINEVLPSGRKDFPNDFLRNDTELDEIEVLGTELHINPHSKTLVSSPKGYFRYQAKNPPEAKYIVYANKLGQKKIKIPKDNLSIFRAVTSYEKYVSDTIKRCFELFLDFTYDEYKAEQFTQIVKEKLDLKEKV